MPNFDGVPPGQFRQFADRLQGLLERRPGQPSRQLLDRDIDSLAALNDFLSHGIFDTDVEGLDRIFWRNRTLQEFFTAYWLAQFCTGDDTALLWDWVCLPERPLSEEYYWVWRFLCEMHEDARHPESWSRAIEPIYRPGDGTAAGTKRSSELIYRGWQPLGKLADSGEAAARRVRDAFLGEFENVILAGAQGDERQQLARQFCDSFLEVPAGEFRMGSPPEKQGMPAELRKQWTDFLAQEGDPAERAEQLISTWSFSPGKQGQEWKQQELDWWTRVFRERDLDAIVHRNYQANETPDIPIHAVDGFLLHRWPTINAWYRLFDPSHGLSASWYAETYARISPQPETPAIFVSWYDAWACCLWARWQGESCRLPREYEWEYAAKAGTPWDQNYWWGDTFDAEKCNADQNVGRTTPPSHEHANPWKFEDILGNVWEWTEDEYRREYSGDKPPDSSARVLRGGSWFDYAVRARSACRFVGLPAYAVIIVGFRVARALLKS